MRPCTDFPCASQHSELLPHSLGRVSRPATHLHHAHHHFTEVGLEIKQELRGRHDALTRYLASAEVTAARAPSVAVTKRTRLTDLISQ